MRAVVAAAQAADLAQILAVASPLQQLTRALTSDTGEQERLLAQVGELQLAAAVATPDRGAVRRIADGVLAHNIRVSGVTCRRSRPMALSVSTAASRTVTPDCALTSACAARPVKVTFMLARLRVRIAARFSPEGAA
jgi:hypothetical protein